MFCAMPEPKQARLNLTESLLEIHASRLSGIFRLERAKAKKQLVVHEGMLSFAESNVPEEHLAHVLIKMHFLSRSDLNAISVAMKSGKAVDEAILTASKVSPQQLQEGAQELAVMIVASLFAWDSCDKHFYAGEGLMRRLLNLMLPLPRLLLLGARRAVALRQVAAAFRMDREGQLVVPTGAKETLNLPLAPEEGMVYSCVKAPIPLLDLFSILPPFSGATAQDLVQRLLLLGLLRLEDAAAESKAGATEAQISQRLDELLHAFEVANLYEILSVPTDASEDHIQAAYYELAKQYHPDRFQSRDFSAELKTKAEKAFTYITGAYTTLSDPAARIGYDEMRLKKDSQVEAALQARAATDLEKEKVAETLYRAGRNELARGEFEKAITQLKECVYLLPNVARYHHYLGVAQSEVPRFRKEAEQHLLKATQLNKVAVDSYIALGKLYVKVNLPRRAEAQFNEALRWDPDNLEARKLLREVSK